MYISFGFFLLFFYFIEEKSLQGRDRRVGLIANTKQRIYLVEYLGFKVNRVISFWRIVFSRLFLNSYSGHHADSRTNKPSKSDDRFSPSSPYRAC